MRSTYNTSTLIIPCILETCFFSVDAATELISLGNFPPLDFNEVFGYKYDPQTNKIISGLGEQGREALPRQKKNDCK